MGVIMKDSKSANFNNEGSALQIGSLEGSNEFIGLVTHKDIVEATLRVEIGGKKDGLSKEERVKMEDEGIFF